MNYHSELNQEQKQRIRRAIRAANRAIYGGEIADHHQALRLCLGWINGARICGWLFEQKAMRETSAGKLHQRINRRGLTDCLKQRQMITLFYV